LPQVSSASPTKAAALESKVLGATQGNEILVIAFTGVHTQEGDNHLGQKNGNEVVAPLKP
jgi:hypothetical protein